MQPGTSAYRFPPIILSLGTLLIISGTVQAGISVSNPVVKQTGDPTTEYDFSIYLTNGTVTPGVPFKTFFTLDNLIGINIDTNPILNIPELTSDIHISNTPYLGFDGWTPFVVGNGTAIVGGQSVDTTTLTFGFTGLFPVTAGNTPVLLGNFSITDASYSIPPLPPGTLSITDQIDGITQPPISFVVAPEPSSLVVVALVGFSLTGVGLLRRWRRVA